MSIPIDVKAFSDEFLNLDMALRGCVSGIENWPVLRAELRELVRRYEKLAAAPAAPIVREEPVAMSYWCDKCAEGHTRFSQDGDDNMVCHKCGTYNKQPAAPASDGEGETPENELKKTPETETLLREIGEQHKGRPFTEYTDELSAAMLEKCRSLERQRNELRERQRWISVKDRLPELGVPVWLYEDGRMWIGGRADFGDGWLWANCYDSHYMVNGVWKCGDLEADDDYEPTLWLQLPPAPKGDDKDA